ncbi:rod shape-determining protein RodA [Treponema sp. UBA3813]|uniref:rod shape-determining protein RodA n=1 Tax=Treponema sp. UBA3813 TaxID=1947715 RepID=UPI001B0D5A2B|nr:rod shape-determining protein RodA [Treponema sp. UBA3813]MBO6218853.1 rod shape-determining protein RodA [Treponema sp.]
MKLNFKFLQFFDFILFFCVVALVTFGVLSIYSSGINSEGMNVSTEYVKQIIWGGTGILLMLGLSLVDYRRLSRYVPQIFIFACAVLIFTKFFGRYVNGARSWLGIGPFGIQPSEFMKVVFILFLAWYLDRTKKSSDQRKRFIISLLIMFIPMALILAQPDLGTALVYFPIFLAMTFIAGIPVRYILFVFLSGMMTILFTVLPIWESQIAHHSVIFVRVLTNSTLRLILIFATGSIGVLSLLGMFFYRHNKYFYWISYFSAILCGSLILSYFAGKVLKEYQVMRLIVFIDPYADPRGAGWNIIQSKTAIGSGNLLGRGYLQGTQSHYRFLPEQSTDFIFSILSEEWGFVGGMVVFALYFSILLRTIFIIKNASNTFGMMIAAGVLGMFAFHFLINVGMVMGIMPITGIPLLFLSYGGSSLWTAMICVGFLMSVSSRKFGF